MNICCELTEESVKTLVDEFNVNLLYSTTLKLKKDIDIIIIIVIGSKTI